MSYTSMTLSSFVFLGGWVSLGPPPGAVAAAAEVLSVLDEVLSLRKELLLFFILNWC